MENIFWIKKLTFFGDYFFFLKEFMFRHIFEKQIRKQLKLYLVWIVKKITSHLCMKFKWSKTNLESLLTEHVHQTLSRTESQEQADFMIRYIAGTDKYSCSCRLFLKVDLFHALPALYRSKGMVYEVHI